MRGNTVIIATNAVFLADTLRDKLRDTGYQGIHAAGDKDLIAKIPRAGARFVLLENCFHGQGTEEFVLRLMKRFRDIRIAVWSTVELNPIIASRFLMAGAESYFTLRDTDENIAGILRRIMAGRQYYPEDVGRVYESTTYFPDFDSGLTIREIEIIKLSINRQSNKKIGEALGIKVPTVKTHKRKIYRKSGGNTAVALIRYGLMRGVICPEDLID
jgi:DNA-binding NarL/FixJ family response regulator